MEKIDLVGYGFATHIISNVSDVFMTHLCTTSEYHVPHSVQITTHNAAIGNGRYADLYRSRPTS